MAPQTTQSQAVANGTARTRVAGSGFTYWHFDDKLIGFAKEISHQSGRPVAPATPIHPMDSVYAVEIVTPAAMGPGTVTVALFERYGQRVWDELTQLTGAIDIVEIFQRVSKLDRPITMVKYIAAPILRGKQLPPYTEEFHNVVISDIADGETTDVTTMEVVKQVTFMYTHTTRGGHNPNAPGGGNSTNLPSPISDSTSSTFG